MCVFLWCGDSVDGLFDGCILGGVGDDFVIFVIEEELGGGGCFGLGFCVVFFGVVLDKLVVGFEERFFLLCFFEFVVVVFLLVVVVFMFFDYSLV